MLLLRADEGLDGEPTSRFPCSPISPRNIASPYYVFCDWLARATNSLFGARLRWGKLFPLSAAEIAPLYPDLEQFKQSCHKVDRNGVFTNDYTKRVLGV